MICKVLAEKLLCKGRVRGEDKEEGRERGRDSLSQIISGEPAGGGENQG